MLPSSIYSPSRSTLSRGSANLSHWQSILKPRKGCSLLVCTHFQPQSHLTIVMHLLGMVALCIAIVPQLWLHMSILAVPLSTVATGVGSDDLVMVNVSIQLSAVVEQQQLAARQAFSRHDSTSYYYHRCFSSWERSSSRSEHSAGCMEYPAAEPSY